MKLFKSLTILTLVCVFLFWGNQFFYITLFSSLLCLIVLHINNYDLSNFNSILIIGHLLQFSLAAFLTSSQNNYRTFIMSNFEFYQTGNVMKILCLGILGIIFGSLFYKIILKFFSKQVSLKPLKKIKNRLIYLSMILYFIYIFLSIYTNTYFHSSAGEVNISNSINLGFIGYLYYFGILAIILQFKNYEITRNKIDLSKTIIILLIVVALIFPSGQRRFIALPVFAFILAVFSNFKQNKKIAKSIFITIPFLFLTLPILEYLRTDFKFSSISEFRTIFIFLIEKLYDFENGGSPILALLVRRLADYPSVGFIYEYMQSINFNYYGFMDLIYSPFYILPTILRPEIPLSFSYDALIMQDIGFRPEIGGSSPMMLIGDAFYRGGYLGVFVIYFLLGTINEFLSSKINLKKSLFSIIIWVFLIDYFSMLHTMHLLKYFTLLTRQMIIFVIIAYSMIYFNNYKSYE